MAPTPAVKTTAEEVQEEPMMVVEEFTTTDSTSVPSLSLSCEYEFASLPCSQQRESLLCVSTIQAPTLELTEVSRPGMDMVAVIDKSGSMAGEKMEMTHKTLQIMIDNLTSRDRLAIVCYSDDAELTFDFTPMNNQGKKMARDAVERHIQPDCSTNLSDGLVLGCDLVNRRTERNDVCSLLLMTDGLANMGVTDKTQLVNLTTDLVKSFKAPATIYTFGFGSDHDADLLTDIARAGGGTYYFMRSPDSVPEAFGDCMGGLMSVVAQTITLTVIAADGVCINKIPTQFPTQTIEHSRQYVIQVGDIFSEETRDIVVDFKVPTTANPNSAYVPLVFKLDYFNVTRGTVAHTIECSTALLRTEPNSQAGQPSILVDEQRNRIRTAQAMEEAKRLADRGELDNARVLLSAVNQQVCASHSASMPRTEKLSHDLMQIHNKMMSPAMYEDEGRFRLASKGRKHWAQREVEVEEGEELNYSTSVKRAVRSTFSAFRTAP